MCCIFIVKRLTIPFLHYFQVFFVPTLQDVAKKAGVSTATVSKVLSNTPYFTEETRNKVMKAVNDLDYVPNLAGRALSSGKTNIIGIVFPYIYDAIFKDPLVMQIIEGIESVSQSRHYNLLLSTPRISNDGPDMAFQQLVRSRYVDGIIAIDSIPLFSVAKYLLQHDIPTVAIGKSPEAEYFVRSDDVVGGETLADYVVELGHRNIGMITVPQDMNYALNDRMVGVKNSFQKHNLAFDENRIVESDFSTSGGGKAASKLMQAYPDTTAVICLNDRTAIGAIRQLRKDGYQVPKDVSVVGYDNIAISAVVSPSVTTIDQHATRMGQEAAEMLFRILDGQHVESMVLPIELIIRSSSQMLKL